MCKSTFFFGSGGERHHVCDSQNLLKPLLLSSTTWQSVVTEPCATAYRNVGAHTQTGNSLTEQSTRANTATQNQQLSDEEKNMHESKHGKETDRKTRNERERERGGTGGLRGLKVKE